MTVAAVALRAKEDTDSLRTNSGLVRSELLAQKLIEHFGARLRALAESYSGLRSDSAGFRLPFTEILNVCHGTFGRRESFAHTKPETLAPAASRRLAARPELRPSPRTSFAGETTWLNPVLRTPSLDAVVGPRTRCFAQNSIRSGAGLSDTMASKSRGQSV